MGKKSSKAPNVVGGAQVDRETAREGLYADRPDQFNPFGSITWDQVRTVDPATGKKTTRWIQNQNLTPQMQKIFDQQMGLMQGRSELAAGMQDRIAQEMGGAPDWAQFGSVQGLQYNPDELRQRAEDAAYQREVMRLDPRFQNQERDLEIKLRNQGLRPGDQAYDAAMTSFGNERTDAYERARLGAVDTGRLEAQQLWDQQMGRTELANALRDKQIQEYLGKRSFSLGEAEQLGAGQSLTELISTFSGQSGGST